MVIEMILRNLFILAHRIGNRNFYPIYKKLIENQWNFYIIDTERSIKEDHL